MIRNNSAIEARLSPTIEALGYELWACVYLREGQKNRLRIYIDSEKGITLSDCERVSRQVGALLDVEDLLQGHYHLEVSSPGLDRPLIKEDHFQRYVGYPIHVFLQSPIDNQRKFKGLLQSTRASGIVLNREGKEFVLTWDNILHANVLPKMNK
ncbi:ribosome maturation factor RimP [Rickettsiella grylli]|uniref:Ribosome maturation factor RimP n=2 Tax=Rickettsiella grylli TaxID=59196 RepID=A8PNL6_9COXI|nr:ribosome maturation factor RimP [Rickettsiella grylli]EDP45769.1 15 kDa protein [Rickettsiella grylli]